MTNSTWTWRLENAVGEPVPLSVLPMAGDDATPEGFDNNGFPTQSDAETWVGEQWKNLLAAGVVGVTLFEDDREVYGPMSLLPAD